MSRPIDVSDYLLGELSPEELLEAERLMRDDPDFRAEAERLRPVVGQLRRLPPEAWENVEPPPLRMPAEATAGGRASAGSGRLAFLRAPFNLRPASAAACSIALLGAGVGVGVALDAGGRGGNEAISGRSVALEPVGVADAGATGTATLASNGASEAEVELKGMRPSAPGSYYELWLLNTPTDLVSLGSFRVPASGDATITVPLPESPGRYSYIDISVERDDGDPGHSGKSVLRAPA